MNHLQQRADEVEDELFHQCLSELDNLAGIRLDRDIWVIHALTQSVYPMGSGERYKLEGKLIIPRGVLDTKLGKIHGTILYQICDELAGIRGESAELYENNRIYVFLNKVLPNHEKKPRKYKFHPRDIP